MDISALLGASTATAPAALSFGAMGGGTGMVTPSGEGVEGLDSFNQLLGNFLSLTGGEGVAGDGTALPGLTTEEVEGGLSLETGSPALPSGLSSGLPSGLSSGLGALLGGGMKGLNLSNLAGAGTSANAGISAKGMEARWAQSGISLLASGSLSGQEINPEVVAFLNDLSQAFTTVIPLADGETLVDGAAPADAEVLEGEIDILTALQGGIGVETVPVAAQPTISSTNSSGPVIPVLTTDTAPSALGVNLTIAGTGLKALPKAPDTNLTASPAPVAMPVIPKLEARSAEVLPVTDSPATSVEATSSPTPTVEPKAAVTTSPQAEPVIAKAAPTGASAPAAAAAAAPTVTNLTTATAPVPVPVTTADAGDGDDDRQGAIALSADLAATVSVDEKAAAKDAAAVKSASTPTVSAPNQPSPTVTDQKAVTTTAAPAPAISVAPPPAAAAQDSAREPEAAPPANISNSPAPAPTPTVTLTPAPATTISTQTPAPTVAKADAKPVETIILSATELTTETEAALTAESDPAKASTTPNPAPHSVTARANSSPAPTTATRPANMATRATIDDGAKPVEGEDLTAAEAAAEDDEAVTNNRMLAPKHMGTEARAEMQADMAGSAQSAGQNQPATRPETSALRAETEDNLLSGAIAAGAKGHESGSSTDGGNEGGAGFAEPSVADGIDPASAGLHAGDNGKVQGNDFAQSLRQTNAPHRANAYTPPGQQMAFHVQRAVQDGNDRVSIQLNPYELGRIDVQLEIGSEGKLRAKVMVENPQTLEMLQKDSKNLEKALQDAGLQTDQDSLSFSLQDSGDQAQQRQEQQDQSGYGTGIASDDVEEEDPAIIAQAQILEFGRVDVRV